MSPRRAAMWRATVLRSSAEGSEHGWTQWIYPRKTAKRTKCRPTTKAVGVCADSLSCRRRSNDSASKVIEFVIGILTQCLNRLFRYKLSRLVLALHRVNSLLRASKDALSCRYWLSSFHKYAFKYLAQDAITQHGGLKF
ncbi:hypothetical protein EVAR_60020_1 [Eumeta japonica]|uniref:Uncharacterized protein n=1 Tax=Eumeta variegata TaxID=151549 RepID=A0A4C1ZN98_EUMVA|nr:hypothetical protein EVAR_60020_1 [Eumeta japonica]